MAGAMFLATWLAMMVAMMTLSLVPMLALYRRALHRGGFAHLGAPTAVAAGGYFFVWQAVGAAAYPAGVAFASATMQWSALSGAVPVLSGATLIVSGLIQLTPWKMNKLRHCRDPEACRLPQLDEGAGAWRHGLELGACCAKCCSGLILALLVLGVMNLAVMTAVAVAITVERLLPKPELVVRLSGSTLLGLGAMAIVRAGSGW